MQGRVVIYRRQLERIANEAKKLEVVVHSPDGVNARSTPKLTILLDSAVRASGLYGLSIQRSILLARRGVWW